VSATDPLAAAAAKAGLVWVLPADGAGHPQALWHAWHEEAVLVVVGGGEQPDPLVGRETATVRVPSKDTGGALLDVRVRVDQLEPRSEAWEAAAFRLRGGRLNAPDADSLTDRWAQGSRLLRLVPQAPSGPAATDGAGTGEVDVQRVRPRTWRPLRSRLRGRAPRRP
jgi:hypothetical protein